MSKANLDRHFPRNGACFLHPSRYARHRLIDELRRRHAAGETVAALARDYELPRAAVLAAIRSTSDDNRMTAKEQRESRAAADEHSRAMRTGGGSQGWRA